MVSKKKRRAANGGNGAEKENDEGKAAEYEQTREQRIKENLERMHKLGILELSRNLKPPPKPKTIRYHKPSPPLSGSPRRSSRIKNIPTINYSQKRVPSSKDNSIKDVNVDVKGCHQCRKRYTALRTKCRKCNLVQGQYCGRCLFTRYGERIKKVNKNPDWICPVCRGICNCNRCCKIKGWDPIGNVYVKGLRLGFKSVAHYLAHTRGPDGKIKDIADEIPSSSKEDEVSGVSHQIDDKNKCKMDEDSNHVLTEKHQTSAT